MITVNIHQAKANLSHYVSLAEAGKKVVLCRRNKPIAQISPLVKRGRRQLGGLKPKFKLPQDFFEPLPEEIVSAFSHSK